ncbi:MAG: hypothetical protein ACJ74B_11555 [Gaiellaceae bacterium]
MDEAETADAVVAQHEVASFVVRLARAVDQTTELLGAATELHQNVAELHGALTEALLDLERLLVEAQKQSPKEPE